MRRRLPLAWALALVALAAGPVAAQVPFARNLLPTRSALGRVGLERNWYAAIPLGSGNERVLDLSIDKGLLFVQTTMGNFHVFDAETGRYLWGANLGTRRSVAQGASVNSDSVFVASTNTLFAFNRKTGRPIWQARLEGIPVSDTACDEHYVMVGLRSGKLVAYSARTLKNPNPKYPDRSPGKFIWAWQTNGPLTDRPIVTEKVVAFGSQDRKVYVALVTQQHPQLLLRYLTGGPISAAMSTYGTRTLIFGSGDANIYAIDLFTGETRWNIATGNPVEQEPLVVGDTVFAINRVGLLVRLDAETGAERWRLSTGGGRFLALGKGRIYLLSHDRDLMIVDQATGRVLVDPVATYRRAGLDLRGLTVAYTNYFDDRLYFASPTGLIVCLREQGQVQPRLLRDPNEPPFGYLPPEGDDPATGATTPPDVPNAQPQPEARPEPDEPPPADAQKKAPAKPDDAEPDDEGEPK
jgi:outer membrane protein assembly factor BamB